MEIKVNIKSMGKRKQSVEPVMYDLPLGEKGVFTVRQLVTELTRAALPSRLASFLAPCAGLRKKPS